MMVSRFSLAVTLFAALTLSVRANAAAPKQNANGFKPGNSPSVKKWQDKTYEQATAAHRPILLYIYDTDEKRNQTAQLMEGAKFLGATDVKAKESSFLLLKDRMGEGNDYPHDWVQMANGGAVLLVLSSDMKVVQAFSKAAKDQITSANLAAAMDAAIKASPGQPAQPAKNTANKNANQPVKKG